MIGTRWVNSYKDVVCVILQQFPWICAIKESHIFEGSKILILSIRFWSYPTSPLTAKSLNHTIRAFLAFLFLSPP